jgi:radical SAM-linked protein
MRDVINKNVTEEDITSSAERIFSRGWSRMKCYFMIGLPTETDEDVAGIAQTGGRLRRLGKKIRTDADVTVSVSSHVPKPHTPFQWCAMDTVDEIHRKQRLLRDIAKEERVNLKYHEAGISHVEGILARGDRRLGDVIEAVWKEGGRFDGWDERFDPDKWERALAATGVDKWPYLNAIPVDGRLPWDHIDVGLAEGFLAWEYRRALKDRLSHPCGKPYKTLLHHTNLDDALADQRKLVCYDCGIACDLTQMREERIVYLRSLGAQKSSTENAPAPRRFVARGRTQAPDAFKQGEGRRFRIKFAKIDRAAFLSHLDLMRLVIRVFRRAGVEMIYSRGFHPKPQLSFSPALGLGAAALGEYCDVRVEWSGSDEELREKLREAAPEGLRIEALRSLEGDEPGLSKRLAFAEWAAWLPQAPADLRRQDLVVQRKEKSIDVARFLVEARLEEAAPASLAWPEGGAILRWRVRIDGDGGAKPVEVVEALTGAPAPSSMRAARLALLDGEGRDPLTPGPVTAPRAAPVENPAPPT